LGVAKSFSAARVKKRESAGRGKYVLESLAAACQILLSNNYFSDFPARCTEMINDQKI